MTRRAASAAPSGLRAPTCAPYRAGSPEVVGDCVLGGTWGSDLQNGPRLAPCEATPLDNGLFAQ